MGEYRREKNNINVSIPDFRKETQREYEYSKRPYQRDYLKGTDWDRETTAKEREKNVEMGRRNTRKQSNGPQKNRQNAYRQVNSLQPKKVHSQKVSATASKGKAKKAKPSSKVLEKRKRMRKKIFARAGIAVLCLSSILVGNFLGKMHARFNKTLNMRNKASFDLSEVVVDESKLTYDTKIKNILIVGADKRESWSESGRSDCVMIATIDGKHQRLKLTSLMRDMYIDIPNHGKDKFNAAYSYGGISLLYQTIAYNFDLQLDGYVLVDFAAFKNVIRKLGGVEVSLTKAEADYLVKAYKHGSEAKVVPGMQNLNGKQALAYTRIRQDAAADFGRTARQRTVMQAILTKAKTKSSSQLLDLAGTVMPYITTDLSNDEIYGCLQDVVTMGITTMDQQRIPLDNSFTQQRINNQAVLVPDLATNKQALQEFIFDYDGKEEE